MHSLLTYVGSYKKGQEILFLALTHVFRLIAWHVLTVDYEVLQAPGDLFENMSIKEPTLTQPTLTPHINYSCNGVKPKSSFKSYDICRHGLDEIHRWFMVRARYIRLAILLVFLNVPSIHIVGQRQKQVRFCQYREFTQTLGGSIQLGHFGLSTDVCTR